jgi:predicted  nucleic acid-binding Zn-ribbon protein
MNEKLETAMARLANNKRDNGSMSVDLPADRQKAIEYGLTQFQQLGHERDELKKENNGYRDQIASLRIENQGLQSQLTEAMSHIKTMMLVRDQAVADRVKYEALFVSIQAQMRAFAVPAAPLVSDADGDRQ